MTVENVSTDTETPGIDDSGDNIDNEEQAPKPPPSDTDDGSQGYSKNEVDTLIADALKNMKSNLDKVYDEKKALESQLNDYKEKERAAEIKRLKDEGKHKEAYESEMQDMKSKLEALERKNVELTRDNRVNDTLSSLTFKSDKARKMAADEITKELLQNEEGEWVHKSGTALEDFAKSYAEDDSNSFLFKKPVSSGTGGNSPIPSPPTDKPTRLLDRPMSEAFKLAREGKLK